MRQAAWLWVTVASTTLLVSPALGREWTSSKGDFSFVLQGDDWVISDQASLPTGVAFLAKRAAGSATLQVVVNPNAMQLHAFEPSTEAGLRESVAAGGGSLIESHRVEHQGMPALDCRFQFGPADHRQEGLARWITTADAIYQVGIVHPLGAALSEPAANFFGGFRLLGQAEVPRGERQPARLQYLPAFLRNLGIGLVLVLVVVAALKARRHAPKQDKG